MSTLRKPLLTGTLVLLSGMGMAQNTNVAVNDNGAPPDPTGKALLDISFSNAAVPKGFLIPRMTQAQRTTLGGISGPAQQGLTVYQTGGTEGFYYWNGGAWIYMDSPNQPWVLTGNFSTNPATNFLGTTNVQPLVFRTGGVNERMRISAAGNVGINQNNPSEKLDLTGAILFTGISATDNAGGIRWNGSPGFNYHEGNVDGSSTGWTKLENDYLEVFGATYNQQGLVTCNQTEALIGPWTTAPVPYGPGPAAPTSAGQDVTPWPLNLTAGLARFRHQWLIKREELNVELNQMAGNTSATQGICPNTTHINTVDFYITSTPNLNPDLLTMTYNIRIKHSALDSLTDFDPTSDPLSVCANATNQQQPVAPGANGWKSFALGSPFVWNGVDNIIVEFCGAIGGIYALDANLAVWCTDTMSYKCNFSRLGNPFPAAGNPCNTTGPSTCGTFAACGMSSACGSAGANPKVRPVMRFTGTNFGLAPAATLGATTGKYIYFNGGFMVEDNTSPGWAASLGPPKSFKGPGRISAEKGVWDDQIRLNDHVFDRYFDGRVALQDAERHGGKRLYSMGEMVNYVERERHLPTMNGRADWNRTGGFSLGDLGNQLWVTTETQALYTVELNERLRTLKALSVDGPLPPDDVQRIADMVRTMPGLTEAQKQALLQERRSVPGVEHQQR